MLQGAWNIRTLDTRDTLQGTWNIRTPDSVYWQCKECVAGSAFVSKLFILIQFYMEGDNRTINWKTVKHMAVCWQPASL